MAVFNDLSAVMVEAIVQRGFPVLEGAIANGLAGMNRQYDPEIAGANDGVKIPLTSAKTAFDTTSGVTRSTVVADTATAITVKADREKSSAFAYGDKEGRDASGFQDYLTRNVASAVTILAEDAVTAALLNISQALPNTLGTGGTNPFTSNLEAAFTANAILSENKIPLGSRWAILGPREMAKAAAQEGFRNLSYSGTAEAIREGQVSRGTGAEWRETQFLPNHDQGAAGTTIAATAAAAVGATTLAIDGLTSRPVAGDRFTVPGDTEQYYVVTAYTGSNSAGNITFTEGLQRAVANNGQLSFAGDHRVNIWMHPDAAVFVTKAIPLSPFATAGGVIPHPSGLSLTWEGVRQNNRDYIEIRIATGVAVIRPEAAVVVMG